MNSNAKIKIMKNGPFIVTGNIPLSEKIIASKDKCNVFQDGRQLPQTETYALCRCGKTKTPPFCDESHVDIEFDGTETASKELYAVRASVMNGPAVDLMDDRRCAYARFCHRNKGNVWELIEKSKNGKYREEAIRAASDCPTGRLVAVSKTGEMLEPQYEPAIEILQDPEIYVSCGIFVKGNIPIESADGELYEIRNRVTLCRCGKSRNKPFCDARHVPEKFSDIQQQGEPDNEKHY